MTSTPVLLPGKSHGWRGLVGCSPWGREERLHFTFHFHALEEEMATHSSTLAWKIPWTEEPGRLQSMGSWRVRHDWTNSLLLFTFMHWRRKWQPLQCSSLENPRDEGVWWAAVYGVTESWTWLKWLSSSSIIALNRLQGWIFTPQLSENMVVLMQSLLTPPSPLNLSSFRQ